MAENRKKNERRGYNMSNDGCALVDLIDTLTAQVVRLAVEHC